MKTRSILPFLVVAAACGGSSPSSSAPHRAPPPATAPAEEERFDELVRDDFFAGLLRGDDAAMARAVKLCEERLARDPQHGEALAWHGASLIAQAQKRFRTGDQAGGIELWRKGLGEMDRAVELHPDDVGTRIPRGAVLLAASPFVPPAQRDVLLDKALSDYERALELQRPRFAKLSRHARSMLLYGLADGWRRRGDAERARTYYQELSVAARGTAYGERADQVLRGEVVESPLACGGCHAR
ncbi:MAG TPA: hypothetical protein VMZ28_05785 [Kofleriaceae bacterium]|nr:hypothetical protein [Kofleriaceae bacterium]